MMTRKCLIYLVCACFAVSCRVALAATKNSSAEENAVYGGIYLAPLMNNPSSLDPAYAQDMYSVEVIQQVFDGLVQFSPDLYVIPGLAENWQVENQGKTYTFFLRKDARFHNGKPVTAEDVVFSLSRLLRVDPAPTILPHLLRINGSKDYLERKSESVSGLNAVDDHTVIINLDQPYAPFLVALGMYQAKILPSDEVLKDEKKFGEAPIGSGPFEFVAWQRDKIIKLKSFADYYRGRPFLDAVEFLIYPGIQIEDVWADFESGKLDQAPIFGNIREKAAGKKGIVLMHRPSLGLQFYGINCKDARLKNADLRAALSLAIDREKLVASVHKGQYEVAKAILPPGLPGYQPQYAAEVDYDLKKAQDHLNRAVGQDANSLGEIEIVSNSHSPIAQAELDFLQKSWAQLGIRSKTKFIPDWKEFEEYLNSDSVQVYRYVWFADIPDPDDILRPLFSSDSPSNYSRYHSEKVDQMLQKGLEMVDPLKRAAFYQNIEQVVQKACPIIPIRYWATDYAFQDSVKGIQLNPLGAMYISLHRVWLEKPSP